MMLGKRARPPMKRNTSMTEFTLDFNHPSDPHNPFSSSDPPHQHLLAPPNASPRNHRRNSADFSADTSHFLRSCSLCKRRLVPGRDIYMYRGDSAFCSLECRQEQIIQDERKERYALSSTAEVCTNGDPPTVTAL